MRLLIPFVVVPLLFLAPKTHAHSYGLRNLRPVGFTQKASANDRQQLFHFQNELGDHYFLYEENSSEGGVRELAGLVGFASNSGHLCSIDLDCQEKAFCSGDCKKLYYEFFNVPPPVGRNSCKIRAFSCAVPAGST
jgi:hypothetical protein